jgi:hypothetical protein
MMMYKGLDLSEMSFNELAVLEQAIQREREQRKEKRFSELTKNAADALTILRKEFPYVELIVDTGEDGFGKINLFDYFCSFDATDFSR